MAPLSWDWKSVRPEALRHRLSTALPFTESANSVLSVRVLVYQALQASRHHLSYETRIGTILNGQPGYSRVFYITPFGWIVQELS